MTISYTDVGKQPERRLVSKKEMAAIVSMKERWLNARMAEGMPHLKVGSRRTLFDPPEAIAWLKRRYGFSARSPQVQVVRTEPAEVAAQG